MALSVAEKGRKDEPVVNEGNVVQQQEQQQPVVEQPVVEQPVVEKKPKYKFGWDKDGATFGSVIRGEAKDVPIEQVLPDYLQWARDNDVPVDYVSLYSTMKDRDTSKSYNENEKEKKNKQMEDVFQGLGNVLVSFANLGGVAAGAPAPTNTESPAELSERQRRLRNETLAQRQAYNNGLFAMMKQQQADEYKKNQYDLKLRQQEWKEKMEQGKLDYNKEKLDIEREYKNGMISYREKMAALRELDLQIKQYQAKTGRMNANTASARESRQNKPVTTTRTDQYGNTTTTTKSYGNGGGTTSKPERTRVDY